MTKNNALLTALLDPSLEGLLECALSDGVNDDSFAHIAILTEQIRRRTEEGAAVSDLALIARARICAMPVPAGLIEALEPRLDSLLTKLEAYSKEPVSERDTDFGEDLLAGVDETIALAAALVRAGRLDGARASAMSAKASEFFCLNADDLADLANLALDIAANDGGDPNMPGLFWWIDPLIDRHPVSQMIDDWARKKKEHLP
jgi:hypothetical protein